SGPAPVPGNSPHPKPSSTNTANTAPSGRSLRTRALVRMFHKGRVGAASNTGNTGTRGVRGGHSASGTTASAATLQGQGDADTNDAGDADEKGKGDKGGIHASDRSGLGLGLGSGVDTTEQAAEGVEGEEAGGVTPICGESSTSGAGMGFQSRSGTTGKGSRRAEGNNPSGTQTPGSGGKEGGGGGGSASSSGGGVGRLGRRSGLVSSKTDQGRRPSCSSSASSPMDARDSRRTEDHRRGSSRSANAGVVRGSDSKGDKGEPSAGASRGRGRSVAASTSVGLTGGGGGSELRSGSVGPAKSSLAPPASVAITPPPTLKPGRSNSFSGSPPSSPALEPHSSSGSGVSVTGKVGNQARPRRSSSRPSPRPRQPAPGTRCPGSPRISPRASPRTSPRASSRTAIPRKKGRGNKTFTSTEATEAGCPASGPTWEPGSSAVPPKKAMEPGSVAAADTNAGKGQDDDKCRPEGGPNDEAHDGKGKGTLGTLPDSVITAAAEALILRASGVGGSGSGLPLAKETGDGVDVAHKGGGVDDDYDDHGGQGGGGEREGGEGGFTGRGLILDMDMTEELPLRGPGGGPGGRGDFGSKKEYPYSHKNRAGRELGSGSGLGKRDILRTLSAGSLEEVENPEEGESFPRVPRPNRMAFDAGGRVYGAAGVVSGPHAPAAVDGRARSEIGSDGFSPRSLPGTPYMSEADLTKSFGDGNDTGSAGASPRVKSGSAKGNVRGQDKDKGNGQGGFGVAGAGGSEGGKAKGTKAAEKKPRMTFQTALARFLGGSWGGEQKDWRVDLGPFAHGRPRLEPGWRGEFIPVFENQPTSIIAHSLSSQAYYSMLEGFSTNDEGQTPRGPSGYSSFPPTPTLGPSHGSIHRTSSGANLHRLDQLREIDSSGAAAGAQGGPVPPPPPPYPAKSSSPPSPALSATPSTSSVRLVQGSRAGAWGRPLARPGEQLVRTATTAAAAGAAMAPALGTGTKDVAGSMGKSWGSGDIGTASLSNSPGLGHPISGKDR
ncbi:unnamed protein product, partial [Discosporangium mesarthrocarpum]